jgi:hypothetical protein
MLQSKANDYFSKNIDVQQPPEKRPLLYQKKAVMPPNYIKNDKEMRIVRQANT